MGLTSLHTGEGGLGIGAQFGALYSGTLVFAVLQVPGSLSGVLDTIDQYVFPRMVLASLVGVTWLLWWLGEPPLQPPLRGGRHLAHHALRFLRHVIFVAKIAAP